MVRVPGRVGVGFAAPFGIDFGAVDGSGTAALGWATVIVIAAVAGAVGDDFRPRDEADDGAVGGFVPGLFGIEFDRIEGAGGAAVNGGVAEHGRDVVNGAGFAPHIERELGPQEEHVPQIVLVSHRGETCSEGG